MIKSVSAIVLRAMTALFSIVLSISIARQLGDINYGYFSVVQALILACTILSKMGMDGALLRFVPKYSDKYELFQIRNIMYVSHVFSFVGSVAVVLFVFAIVNILNSFPYASNVSAIVTCAAYLIVYTQFTIIESQMISIGKTIIAQVLSFVSLVLSLMLVELYGFLSDCAMVYADIFICMIASFSIVAIAGALYVRKHNENIPGRPRFEVDKAWVASGLLFALVNLLNYIQLQSGPLYCGYLGGPVIAARFAVIAKIGVVVLLGQQAITMLEVANISRLLNRGMDRQELQENLRNITLRCLAVGVLSSLAAAVLSPTILSMYGSEYNDCYPSVLLFVFGLLFTSAFGPLNQVVYLSGYQRDCILAYVINAICFGLLSFCLIPLYGATGAVYAAIISRVQLMITLLIIVRYRLGINPLFIFGV